MQVRTIYLYAGILGLLAVILGAFGAHALKNYAEVGMLKAWEKAVLYQFIHTLGLLILPTVAQKMESGIVKWIGVCWIIGVILFSGSIYLLVLTNLVWLGPVTPFGGLFFIAGWIFLIVGAFKSKK